MADRDRMLVAQDHAFGAIERVGAGDDDLIADRKSIQDLDFGDAGGTETHRMPFGHIAVHEVGKAAAVLIHEGATIDHQYIVPLIDENPDRQSLTLPQARRLFIAEAQARRDLTTDDFGRYSAHAALPVAASPLEIGAHTGAKIARQALGYFDFHF